MLRLDEFVNPFTMSGNWYKANLHTHTTTSDGSYTVDEIVEKYSAAGYKILALTDHRKTNDISAYAGRKDILVISGMECHPACLSRDGSRPEYHIVAINIPRDFSCDNHNASRCVEQISQAGGVPIMAHPFWSGHDMTEMVAISGVAAMEVYNSTCGPCEDSSSEWSLCLGHGYYLGGVASDDTHRKDMRDTFGGWTWLKAKSLNAKNVVTALKTGAYYASCGPEIKDFRIDGKAIKISCSPAEKVILMGLSHGRWNMSWADDGNLLTNVEIPLNTVKSRPFIRAIVVDAAGKKAWTNPIAFPD